MAARAATSPTKLCGPLQAVSKDASSASAATTYLIVIVDLHVPVPISLHREMSEH
jgi:hypothetical protein